MDKLPIRVRDRGMHDGVLTQVIAVYDLEGKLDLIAVDPPNSFYERVDASTFTPTS